jgi:hypothetical protein
LIHGSTISGWIVSMIFKSAMVRTQSMKRNPFWGGSDARFERRPELEKTPQSPLVFIASARADERKILIAPRRNPCIISLDFPPTEFPNPAILAVRWHRFPCGGSPIAHEALPNNC